MTVKRTRVVIDGPVLKDGVAMRMVKFAEGGSQVEVWRNGRWTPGGTPFDLLEAGWLRREEFTRMGIPFEVAAEYPFDRR